MRAQLDTGFIINLPFLAPWGLERMLQSLLHLVQKGLKFSEVALVAAHCLTGFNMIFFSIWVFFPEHSWIIGLEGNGEDISLTPHYHLHPLRRYLDISRTITAESSPLHIASCRTRTGSLWFPSASSLLSYNYFQFFLSLLLVQSKHLKPWWYLIFHIDGAQHYPFPHVQ